jgi:tRNA(fMet)-specific endonuclease VapC
MTMRFLLDTNVLSQLLRDPRGAVAARLSAAGEANVFTSIVVASELRFGARKKGSTVLTDRVDQLLASIEVAPLEVGVDRIYADIRNALESSGQTIGANDLFIAAHAFEQQATLVTDNVAEFQRVPGLAVEHGVRPVWLDQLKPAPASDRAYRRPETFLRHDPATVTAPSASSSRARVRPTIRTRPTRCGRRRTHARRTAHNGVARL